MQEKKLIARLNIPARCLRVAAGLFGAFAMLLTLKGVMENNHAETGTAAALAMTLVPAWLSLCLVARNLAAFRLRPAFEISGTGLHVRLWKEVGFLGMFLPYHTTEIWNITWAAYRGCQVFTQRVNGVPMLKELYVFIDGGRVTIPRGIFNLSVERLQTAILDYREIQFRHPQRVASGLADFQRLRFAQPLTITYWTVPVWLALAPLGITLALQFVGPDFLEKGQHVDVMVWAWLLTVVASLYLLPGWWGSRQQGRIELRADGLMLAPRHASRPAVPWNDVLFVRACTKTSTWGYGSADDGKTPGVLEALEIRYADGRSERISGPPLKTLTRLHALLEPDLDLVVKARSRIAAGEAPELAAKAVGLATRD